ncbi:hypothetical protein N9Y92_02605 [Chlamydiales bacterium]|nr:hypothetical protein [Chlamydiales bacterium]
MIRYLTLFIATFSSLFSNDFASFESPPETIVNNKVSIVSGTFIDVNVDMTVPSIEPLQFVRVFTPPEYKEENRWEGWNINIINSGHLTSNSASTHAYIYEGLGTQFNYWFNSKVLQGSTSNPLPKGATNVGRGEISGKTNLKNHQLTREDKNTFFHLKLGSGEEKIYSSKDLYRREYYKLKLEKEIKPSGNAFVYTYPSKNHTRIQGVSNDNSHMGSYNLYEQPEKKFYSDNTMLLEAEDGRRVHYKFKMCKWGDSSYKNGKWYTLLEKVSGDQIPTIEYSYDNLAKNHNERLIKKSLPDGRYVKLEYYTHTEKNSIQGINQQRGDNSWKHWTFKFGSDYWLNDRIKLIKEPAGPNGEEVYTSRFLYFRSPDNYKFDTNWTDVFDAENHLTRYFLNRDFRPIKILTFSGTPEDYTYDIDEDLTWDEGNLVSRRFYHYPRSEYQAKSYIYDDRGNVLQETFWGNLSGKNSQIPHFEQDGSIKSNNADSYMKSFVYSTDGFNNKLMESFPNGLKVHYNYLAGTNKIAEEVTPGLQINRYHYDGSRALQRMTQEDGNTCLITDYKPIRTCPNFGFSEETKVSYFDPKTNSETLLKKTRQSYHPYFGQIISQEVFDADNNYCYTLKKGYDNLGNCNYETTPLGHEIHRTFDQNRNLVKEVGPNPQYIKTFTYDTMNRCRQETEIFPDGTELTTRHTYNSLNHRTSTTDPFGQTTHFLYDRYGHLIQNDFA